MMTMPKHKILVATALATMAVASSCGGNYSNEDVEFQAALPAASDLRAQPPVALVLADSAEYYLLTRQVTTTFNGMVNGILTLVDTVRAYPATKREARGRLWGPFPDKDHPGWLMRVLMAKVDDPTVAGFGYRFDYQFQVRAMAAPADAWVTLLAGSYAPGQGARIGAGRFTLDTQPARSVGYVVDEPRNERDFNDLAVLDVSYNTGSRPLFIDLTVTTIASAVAPARLHYRYAENADRSGSMSYTIGGRDLWVQELRITASWRPDGAGRGDATVTAGLATGMIGRECWGADTRATFVSHPWKTGDDTPPGTEATCLLPAPLP